MVWAGRTLLINDCQQMNSSYHGQWPPSGGKRARQCHPTKEKDGGPRQQPKGSWNPEPKKTQKPIHPSPKSVLSPPSRLFTSTSTFITSPSPPSQQSTSTVPVPQRIVQSIWLNKSLAQKEFLLNYFPSLIAESRSRIFSLLTGSVLPQHQLHSLRIYGYFHFDPISTLDLLPFDIFLVAERILLCGKWSTTSCLNDHFFDQRWVLLSAVWGTIFIHHERSPLTTTSCLPSPTRKLSPLSYKIS